MKTLKRCSKCGIEKSSATFNKNKANLDGLQSYCKSCQQVLAKTWRSKNSERVKKYDAEYRRRHSEERREYNKRWREENEGYWRQYQNKQLHNDVNFRLHNYISSALRRAIKKDRQSVFNLLGYSVEDLRRHLESLFQDGMSWQNYGTAWHIDHVIPKSWFNLENEYGIDLFELEICWSLRNLQPLWGSENLKKKNNQISSNKAGRLSISRDQFRMAVERHKRGEGSGFREQSHPWKIYSEFG